MDLIREFAGRVIQGRCPFCGYRLAEVYAEEVGVPGGHDVYLEIECKSCGSEATVFFRAKMFEKYLRGERQ